MIKKIGIIIKIVVTISLFTAFVSFCFEQIGNIKNKNMNHKPYGLYEKYIKRPLDVFLSTGALIVFSPIMLITAVLVKFKLGSPVLFTQDRPGKIDTTTHQPNIFKLYKFRTMTDKKDDNGVLLPDDERLTEFGKKIRMTSLDELPELFNIIKGDMSIIGPRPLLVSYLPYYKKTEKHRHDVRPGLTGLAQINGRNLVKWDQRLAFDVEYVNSISFYNDLKILLQTIKKVVKKEDIVTDTIIVEPYLYDERKDEVFDE